MKPHVLAFIFIINSLLSLYSQNNNEKLQPDWQRFIYLESGFIYPEGSIKENIAIRQNINSFYVNQGSYGHIYSESSGFTAGLRWEYFNTKFKTGVSSGLRYTGYNTGITGFSSWNARFFYLRYSIFDNNTKFARVTSINESLHFISVPVELRFVPLEYSKFGLFIKVGGEFSYKRLSESTSIDFFENHMKVHHDTILNSLGLSTGKHYSTLYSSAGLKLGKHGHPNFLIEVFMPSYFLTRNNFNLTESNYFEGVKFSLQIPVNRTVNKI
jgi:hypothetical protein